MENYKISRWVRSKLKDIECFVGNDIGEWENDDEERLMEGLSDICVVFQDLIDGLHKKEKS